MEEIASGAAVAPYTGAWIETQAQQQAENAARRTLYGCVD